MGKLKKNTSVRSVRYTKGRKRIKRLWSAIKITLATVVAATFAILFLMPIVLTITNSFMSASEISANYGTVFATTDTGGKVFIAEKVNLKFIPDMVSFSQYITVLFKSPEYLLKFWNSVILVGPIVIFQLIVASLASYGFARYNGKLRQIVFFTYIILMLMPYQVTLVPNYLVADWLQILDSYWAIWLPGIFSPFAVFLLTKFMKRIPASVIEAAQMDGAGEWQIYRKICMPLCKGALCSAAILVFIDYWNMVEQPLILLTDAEKHPLSVFLSKINAGEIGLAFAVATIYMVPSLLVFLYGEEYLVDGITYQGGIKG
ncbi:MAG: carbohydrate ABC transporter permease [Lachnospiraceae bacterium]|nr:carbohydrate ABC transporter permease [Lachnospiraceae bacterium]